MADPFPNSIVVIHGVGDHKEDETAKTFSRALARARGSGADWSPPSLVTRTGDVQCEVEGAEAGVSPTEAFSFSAYKIDVPWPESKWAVLLYEFYWSNLSRSRLGLLGEVTKVWRFLVGPPRIGYHALTTPASGRLDGFVLGSARVFYCLTWLVVIFRLIVSLALILALGLFKLDAKFLRYYDTMLATDLVISTLLLGFSASWWFLLLPALRRRPNDVSGLAPGKPGKTSPWGISCLNLQAFESVGTAALALAVTILFTQAVPFTILEVTKLDKQFQGMEPWRYLGEPYDAFLGFLPAHFYSINTWPGFMAYLMYGLIVLWAILIVGCQYGLTVQLVKYPVATSIESALRSNPRRDVAVARMERVVFESKLFWMLMMLLVITVLPALFWVEFLRIEWYDAGLYLYNRAGSTPRDVVIRYYVYAWLHFIVYVFIVMVWGLITWPTLRRKMVPALELAFDVGAYFPRVLPSLSRAAFGDLIYGRGASGNARLLERELAARLRTVIRYAYDQKPGPVAVVGHSLGAVIAMTALKEPLEGSDRKKVAIDLVTMGSPLRMLREQFPHLYSDARWSKWKFPGVRRWLNLYRAGDPIGRDLGISGVDEVNIGNGGHSAYFEDPHVAAFLVNWFYPSLTTAAPATGTDTPAPGQPTITAADPSERAKDPADS